MELSEALTRGTAWMALALYVVAEFLRSRGDVRRARIARIVSSLGCGVFVVHVGCAFHFYHGWSHAAAYIETARQTAASFGWNWGGGLYFNYAFLALWAGQVIHSWRQTNPDSAQPTAWGWIARGFAFMMIFNGTVVFAHGPMLWLGAVLCLVLIYSWWNQRKGE